MKYNCDIVRDLMPLYLDHVCSDASVNIVEEHMNECTACRNMFDRMRSEELEAAVAEEKREVLDRQAGYFKKKTAAAGAVIAGIFMIPVLVCLIVNLATGKGLDWFFIVLCALLVAASLSVVPLMVPENKALWTLGTFTGSLILLIGTVNLYYHGRTFFPAAAAILFAFSAAFLPAVIRTKPVAALGIRYKGLIVMLIDTALFILLLFTAAFYMKSPGMFGTSLTVALPFIGAAWAMFLVLYFPKCGKLIKTGFCLIILGLIMFLTEYTVNRILGYDASLPVFSPGVWTYDTMDGNIKWIILIAFAAAGIIFIIAGLAVRISRGKRR